MKIIHIVEGTGLKFKITQVDWRNNLGEKKKKDVQINGDEYKVVRSNQ